METDKIRLICYQAKTSYSAYSYEINNLEVDGETIEELQEKAKFIIQFRVNTLKDIGKYEDAERLAKKELVFVRA